MLKSCKMCYFPSKNKKFGGWARIPASYNFLGVLSCITSSARTSKHIEAPTPRLSSSLQLVLSDLAQLR